MKRFSKAEIFIFSVALIFALGVSSCNDQSGVTVPERNYELVWSDEFNDDQGSSVDPTKWAFDIGRGGNGWGNNELQSYTDNTNNVAHDGEGNLVITARKSGSSYTSGRIKTKDLYTQQYGRVEARIKTPRGHGMWPAFWMLGQNIDEVGWPKCGEIDIMEQKGQYPFTTHGSLHGPSYFAGNAVTNTMRLDTGNFTDDFYVYAVEWGEDYIDFFVDDELYHRTTATRVPGDWVYNQPFFLILNLAVGGSFVGPPNDNTPFPGSMYVDYVRVYKEI